MKSSAINKQSTTGTAFTYTNLQEQDLQHWIPYLRYVSSSRNRPANQTKPYNKFVPSDEHVEQVYHLTEITLKWIELCTYA